MPHAHPAFPAALTGHRHVPRAPSVGRAHPHRCTGHLSEAAAVMVTMSTVIQGQWQRGLGNAEATSNLAFPGPWRFQRVSQSSLRKSFSSLN